MCTKFKDAGGEEVFVKLTEKGREVAREGELERPTESTVVFYYDGLTRKPIHIAAERLLRPRDLKNAAMGEIRAFPARPPVLEEIELDDVRNALASYHARVDAKVEILSIRSLERRERMFTPSVSVVYRAHIERDLQVAFAIDGRLSKEHEAAFARKNGVDQSRLFTRLKERQEQTSRSDVLGTELSRKVDVAERDYAAAIQETAASATCEVDGGSQPDAASKTKLPMVRPLAVYEHAPLLRESLESAAKRVMIISPWIREAVVGNDFLRSVREAAERNVRIFVGYGLGRDHEKPEDRRARLQLEAIGQDYNSFVLRRLGDTHAKILIKDDEFFVISSFNWLSFRGDPNRTFREEWGTIVRDEDLVDEFFEQMVGRFDDD